MDLRLFSTFLRVAELQNFTKAAEQLGYSQATVTVQIHQLEQALGIQLFERIGKRVRMTEHGEQFIICTKRSISARSPFPNRQ